MTSISLRLDNDLLESLDDEARQTGISRSEYIRATLETCHEATCYVINTRSYKRIMRRLKRVTRISNASLL